MAEGIVRKEFADNGIDAQIDSAGTAAYHIGEGADSRAQAELRKHGIDISEEAVELAKSNAEFTDLSSQVKFFKLDIFNYDISSAKEKFDIIVSNPPYVSDEEYKTLQKEIIEYEPLIALTDNSDGFKFYEYITSISKALIKEGGSLFYEIGKGQAKKVKSIMEQNGFTDIKVKSDYAEIERVVYGVIS
jgi:release factor glutamine methyltransferase